MNTQEFVESIIKVGHEQLHKSIWERITIPAYSIPRPIYEKPLLPPKPDILSEEAEKTKITTNVKEFYNDLSAESNDIKLLYLMIYELSDETVFDLIRTSGFGVSGDYNQYKTAWERQRVFRDELLQKYPQQGSRYIKSFSNRLLKNELFDTDTNILFKLRHRYLQIQKSNILFDACSALKTNEQKIKNWQDKVESIQKQSLKQYHSALDQWEADYKKNILILIG